MRREKRQKTLEMRREIKYWKSVKLSPKFGTSTPEIRQKTSENARNSPRNFVFEISISVVEKQNLHAGMAPKTRRKTEPRRDLLQGPGLENKID